MNAAWLTNNWALLLAVAPGLVALFIVVRVLLSRTASGQLNRVLTDHRAAQRMLAKASKASRKASSRLEQLTSNAGQTKPRLIEEAREAVEDAQALEKIADDKFQVTANHVRRVIYEEFPPVKHEKLRNKFLPQDAEEGRPYTF